MDESTVKAFATFLYEHGCLTEFIDNILVSNVLSRSPEYLVTESFTWEATKEGHGYWMNIEAKWWDYMEERV